MQSEQGKTGAAVQSVRLEYGTQRPWSARRILLYTGIALLLAAAATVAVLGCRPQWKRLRGQWDVKAVIAPRGAVLYSEDPAQIAKLSGQTQYEKSHSQNVPQCPAVERVAAWRDEGTGTSTRSGMPPIGLRRVLGCAAAT